MRTPLRDSSGVALLFQYYNQLYFVERRFFPPDRSLGIYFEWWVVLLFWFDSHLIVFFINCRWYCHTECEDNYRLEEMLKEMIIPYFKALSCHLRKRYGRDSYQESCKLAALSLIKVDEACVVQLQECLVFYLYTPLPLQCGPYVQWQLYLSLKYKQF